jgi:hypothetical protein
MAGQFHVFRPAIIPEVGVSLSKMQLALFEVFKVFIG